MSLRVRLTLLYTLTLTAVLLLFGALVYGLVSTTMIGQIDRQLQSISGQFIQNLRVDEQGRFDPAKLNEFKSPFPIQYQVWGEDGSLQLKSPLELTESMDSMSLTYRRTGISTINHMGESLRVLTVPISNQRGPVGTVQLSMSLDLIENLRSSLGGILLSMALILSVIVAIGSWWLTGKEIASLERVTSAATKITQVDDLSRRISLRGEESLEVTELVQSFNHTMERLEKLFNTQRQFTADVSHELRTPLTVIKGEAGIMRQTGQLDQESVQNIDREVGRLTRLVDEILVFSQAEAGSLKLDIVPRQLDTLLLEVHQAARTLAGDRVKVVLDDIAQLTAEIDADRIKQVLINLVSNALTYTPNGGVITLGMRDRGEKACIRVSDNGPGISKEDLPHIFDRFYRSEKSRTRGASTGFGLGLSIADLIVKKHHGLIRVKSKEGEGTTFYVSLPLEQPKAE